jgi:hypothetical protein
MPESAQKPSQTINNLPQHHGWTRVLAVLAAVAILLCTYATVLRDNFATAAKAYVFMRNAQTFVHISDAVKAEVSENLPQSVKDNFLQNALSEKLLDIIVTPENVAKVAEPILTAAYKVVDKTDAQVKNNNVVIESGKYKSQATKFVSDSKLPPVLSEPLNSLINSVPGDIKIVDGQKNPDSPILMLVKLKAAFQKLNTIVAVLWWIIVLSLAGIVALNYRNYRAILRISGLVFGISGLIITIGSWMFAPVALLFVPQSTDKVIGDTLNQAIADIINSYFNLTRPYGFFLVLLGLALYLLYRFDAIHRVVVFAQSKQPKTKPHTTQHHSSHTYKK